MNRFMQMIMLFRLLEGVEPAAGAPTGAAVADPAPISVDPTPVSTDPAQVIEPAAAVADPAAPDDPMSALEAAMAAELPADTTPQTPAAAEAPAIPAEFAEVLSISPFVTDANTLQQAVAAADEVWKVASGQSQASQLLEGMRAANPQGFQAVVENLIPYLEQVTGRKFTDQPAAPPDPNQARLDAIEQRFAQEEKARADAQWNQQVTAAHQKAVSFLTEKAKGTFAEGNEAYLLQQCGAKAGIPEQQMVEMLLTGKTEKLEAAYREVVKDEVARLKAYNANLIKKHRTLAGAVPAVKGAPQKAAATDFDAYLPGETPIQYATRQFQKGQK